MQNFYDKNCKLSSCKQSAEPGGAIQVMRSIALLSVNPDLDIEEIILLCLNI